MKTILVVDDEFDLSGMLRAILEGEGYRAETCSNGREALRYLETSRPDLVLMDVMMPLAGGFEVLQTMRRTPGLDGIPVLLMSAVAPAVKQADYGWQAFLRKPFSLHALLASVEALIGKADAPRQDD